MNDQIRSADLLVTTALADPQILSDLKTNTEDTLKKLSADAVQQLPRGVLLRYSPLSRPKTHRIKIEAG